MTERIGPSAADIAEKYDIGMSIPRKDSGGCAAWQPVDPGVLPTPAKDFALVRENGEVQIPSRVARKYGLPIPGMPLNTTRERQASTIPFEPQIKVPLPISGGSIDTIDAPFEEIQKQKGDAEATPPAVTIVEFPSTTNTPRKGEAREKRQEANRAWAARKKENHEQNHKVLTGSRGKTVFVDGQVVNKRPPGLPRRKRH